uniref:Uncharacterized protein n=1 Tax=Molossus molossus TaxID=27622 RepID=A0A7J8FSP0_MOLMO|nr:hypothetical protein HJG59_008403 [Molossus molossus]
MFIKHFKFTLHFHRPLSFLVRGECVTFKVTFSLRSAPSRFLFALAFCWTQSRRSKNRRSTGGRVLAFVESVYAFTFSCSQVLGMVTASYFSSSHLLQYSSLVSLTLSHLWKGSPHQNHTFPPPIFINLFLLQMFLLFPP